MDLNLLLSSENIDPSTVLVMRHRPTEGELRNVLPWLAQERPEIYNAYQRSHHQRQEDALGRATRLVSLIGHEPGKAVFVGIYSVGAHRPVSVEEFWAIPENQELRRLGMADWSSKNPERKTCLWFDLQVTDTYSEWKGKLILDWPGGERAWARWAGRNEFRVHAILDETLLVPRRPVWDQLVLSWEQLHLLPSSWRLVISQWRGVYLIFDTSDGRSYVGSAYGQDNLLGRWLDYSATGHGGNKMLRDPKRRPENFRFSILQLLAQNTPIEEVVAVEGSWKDRLHTREFGLNDN